MTTLTPETVTLETVEEYIRAEHCSEETLEYYNTESTRFIRNPPKPHAVFFKRWIAPLCVPDDQEIWIFGADKAGLDSQTTVADFCAFFDIDLTNALLSHIAETNAVMRDLDRKIWTPPHNKHDIHCEINEIVNDYFRGRYIIPNRKGTLVFSLSAEGSLTRGYFHYFNVIGAPDEVKRAYYFMLKHMDYSESCWGGPW